MSFPLVGNLSVKRGFRTSQNDTNRTSDCLLTDDLRCNLIKNLVTVCTFSASFPRRRKSKLTKNGCPITDLGHDGQSWRICEHYYNKAKSHPHPCPLPSKERRLKKSLPPWRWDLRISPPLTGGDKGEGVRMCVATYCRLSKEGGAI